MEVIITGQYGISFGCTRGSMYRVDIGGSNQIRKPWSWPWPTPLEKDMTGSPGHDRNTKRIIMRITIALVRIMHCHELTLRLLKNDDNDHGQQPQEHGI